MDLNLIIYENDTFLNQKIIFNLIQCCINLDYKAIALSVQINGDNVQKLPIPPTLKLSSDKSIKIYKRLTVRVEDINCLYHLVRHENLKHYDLLAIEPLNEKILNYLNGGSIDFDILTFNQIDKTLVNVIKKVNFSLPISKAIGIEINYCKCLQGSGPRRQTLAFGQMLVDKTNGKNIILSSGTNSPMQIRSPRDVIYMGLLFGLPENQCKKSVYEYTTKVIKRSELRNNISTSIIEIVGDEQRKNQDQAILDELKIMNKKPIDDNDKLQKQDEYSMRKKRKIADS